MTVVDTTILKVWYAFNADGVKDVNTCIGQQCLDLEKRIMKYCSDFFSSRIFWLPNGVIFIPEQV